MALSNGTVQFMFEGKIGKTNGCTFACASFGFVEVVVVVGDALVLCWW